MYQQLTKSEDKKTKKSSSKPKHARTRSQQISNESIVLQSEISLPADPSQTSPTSSQNQPAAPASVVPKELSNQEHQELSSAIDKILELSRQANASSASSSPSPVASESAPTKPQQVSVPAPVQTAPTLPESPNQPASTPQQQEPVAQLPTEPLLSSSISPASSYIHVDPESTSSSPESPRSPVASSSVVVVSESQTPIKIAADSASIEDLLLSRSSIRSSISPAAPASSAPHADATVAPIPLTRTLSSGNKDKLSRVSPLDN